MVTPTAKLVTMFTGEEDLTAEHYEREVIAPWRAGFMGAEDKADLLNNSLAPKVARGICMRTHDGDPEVMLQVLL